MKRFRHIFFKYRARAPIVRSQSSYLEQIKIKILNLQLGLVGLVIFFFLCQSFINQDQDLLIPTLSLLVTLVFIWANNNGHFKYARFGWLILYPVLILGLTYAYGEELRAEYAYFGFIMGALIFYERNWLRASIIAMILLFYLASEYCYENIESPYAEYVYPNDDIVMFTISVLCAAIVQITFFWETKKHYELQDQFGKTLQVQNDKLVELVKAKKQINERLSANKRALEIMNEQLVQFAYIASHDLKTPLRNISSFIDLLSRSLKGIEDPDVKDYLRFIKDGAKKMHYQIEGVLETTKYQNKSLSIEPVSIPELIPGNKRRVT